MRLKGSQMARSLTSMTVMVVFGVQGYLMRKLATSRHRWCWPPCWGRRLRTTCVSLPRAADLCSLSGAGRRRAPRPPATGPGAPALAFRY